MDFLIGIVGNGFVLVGADSAQARSVVIMKESMKDIELFFLMLWRYGQDDPPFRQTVDGVLGSRYSAMFFANFLSWRHCSVCRIHPKEFEAPSNAKWSQIFTVSHCKGFETSPWAAANFIRHQLATALRKVNLTAHRVYFQGPYQVNLLLAGCDETGAQLYYMDYLASMNKVFTESAASVLTWQVPFAVHGYGSFFVLSLLDRWYRPGMNLDEALDLMRRCFVEVSSPCSPAYIPGPKAIYCKLPQLCCACCWRDWCARCAAVKLNTVASDDNK